MLDIYEASDGKGNCIIVLDKKNARTLLECLSAGSKANKRKKTWKTLVTKFNKYLACY